MFSTTLAKSGCAVAVSMGSDGMYVARVTVDSKVVVVQDTNPTILFKQVNEHVQNARFTTLLARKFAIEMLHGVKELGAQRKVISAWAKKNKPAAKEKVAKVVAKSKKKVSSKK